MAQDFERVLKSSIGTSATEVRAAANSDDAIIGMRFANKGTTAVTVDATVKNSSVSYYLIKDAPIPAGGSLELIDGAKPPSSPTLVSIFLDCNSFFKF